MSTIPATDLTQRPPRSPRLRLGGYVLLPRMLDKARATLAGKNGEYHYNCPLDQHFLNFAGVDADALLAELKAGKGDAEILEWILANRKNKHHAYEIEAWSNYMDRRGPDSDAETRGYFYNILDKTGSKREDVRSWTDLLDVDDYVSFGGAA